MDLQIFLIVYYNSEEDVSNEDKCPENRLAKIQHHNIAKKFDSYPTFQYCIEHIPNGSQNA